MHVLFVHIFKYVRCNSAPGAKLMHTNRKQLAAAKLDQDQISELREIFRSFDRNNDGSLTPLELGSLLQSLGLKASHEQVEALVRKVEFSEFVAVVKPELLLLQGGTCPYSEEMHIFDMDGNGYITAAELAHSMAKLGQTLTAEELIGMMEEADMDGDGQIDFQEFERAITSTACLR